MKNANELRKELSAVFDQLAKGALSAKDASELANIAGKMINSAKVQLEYNQRTGVHKRISFLESDD